MANPNPDTAVTDDIYGLFDPEPIGERIAPFVENIKEGFKSPDEASGWAGIIIPALVTALLINIMRRWL